MFDDPSRMVTRSSDEALDLVVTKIPGEVRPRGGYRAVDYSIQLVTALARLTHGSGKGDRQMILQVHQATERSVPIRLPLSHRDEHAINAVVRLFHARLLDDPSEKHRSDDMAGLVRSARFWGSSSRQASMFPDTERRSHCGAESERHRGATAG